MSLLPDWPQILRKAWSVKFTILVVALSGCEVYVAFAKPAVTSGLFAAAAALVSAGALLARVLSQGEVEK